MMAIGLMFGEEMVLRRRRRGMSQGELAGRVRVHRSIISNVERGKVMPTPALEKAIRDVLDWREGSLDEEDPGASLFSAECSST